MLDTVDEQGANMIVVSKADLTDFPKFIECLRSKGYGGTTGIVKVRLRKDDRNDDKSVQQIISHLQRKFRETVILKEVDGKKISPKRVYAFNIAKQTTLKAAVKDHIYEYVQENSDAHRQTFIAHVMDPASYQTTQNCCTIAVAAGLSCAREHFFEVLDKRSPYTPELEHVGVMNDAVQRPCDALEPLLYAAGVPGNEALQIPIGNVLNMSKLGTIIDKLEVKYDGVAFPYLYCGLCHSFFCWHIEDGALASINYVFSGGSKIWFAIPPKYFGRVDKIVQGYRIDKAHSECRSVLADHKSVLFDPEYMFKKYGIPYTIIKQDPGDFVITWPYTLHAGFNVATNLAIAVNFAYEEWIDEGIYAPICGCRQVVKLDLTPLLKMLRPHLLQTWREADSLTFPKNHPREIWQTPDVATQMDLVQKTGTDDSHHPKVPKKRKVKMYECPNQYCKTVYAEHRQRLKCHIEKAHTTEAPTFLKQMEERYPSPSVRVSSSHQCPVCGTNIYGSVSHLERHLTSQLKNAKLDADMLTKYAQELKNLSMSVKRRRRHQKAE